MPAPPAGDCPRHPRAREARPTRYEIFTEDEGAAVTLDANENSSIKGERDMPQIIVTAGAEDSHQEATVMLRERVNATDFESERFAANLLERLGWAVEDAAAAEQREFAAERDTEPQPGWDPEPVGVA